VVEVVPELEQFIFEICGRPEQRVIQILASNRADEPFDERMRGTQGTLLISVTSKMRKLACH